MGIKKVYFVRHGETEGNAGGYFQFPDTPLTQTGHDGARALAERFRHLKIDELIVSPFLRTQQTAEPISKVLDLPIITYEDFHEIDQATVMRGVKIYSDAGKAYNELYYKEHFISSDHQLEGLENYHDVITRVKSCITMLEENKNENILVVSHGNFLRFVIAYLLMGKKNDMETIMTINHSFLRMSNVGITEFVFDVERWKLFTLNDHAHFAE